MKKHDADDGDKDGDDDDADDEDNDGDDDKQEEEDDNDHDLEDDHDEGLHHAHVVSIISMHTAKGCHWTTTAHMPDVGPAALPQTMGIGRSNEEASFSNTGPHIFRFQPCGTVVWIFIAIEVSSKHLCRSGRRSGPRKESLNQ